jgi:N-acetylneuraminic acid mutarotase
MFSAVSRRWIGLFAALVLIVIDLLPLNAAANPTWSATGFMTTFRLKHTATLLPNGKILVAGGQNVNSGSSYLRSAELYDPQTGIWSATGSMNTNRNGHTATLLANGKVLVTGGFNDSGTSTSAELYDPQTGIWSTTASMNAARADHTATLLANGNVLIAGGNSGSVLSSAEVYNPQLGTWSSTGSMNTSRYLQTATLLNDGKVLVVGGEGENSEVLNSAELYNPQTATWSATARMSTSRFSHTATLLANGKVLVVGGQDVTSYLRSAELYDPQTLTWSTTGSMSTGKSYHTATLLLNGLVLVAGGVTSSAINSISSISELYDPQTGIWNITAPMGTARVYHTATVVLDGRVIVAGGLTVNGTDFIILSSAEVYTPPATLSYFSLPPCRIVDTRKTTSPSFSAGSKVAYKVNGPAFDYSSQGGSALGCGIPTDAKAVFFNFVAVNASGPGFLQAWPVGSSIPTASVLNYANVPNLNIANGVILPVCDPLTTSCNNDLNIQANQASVQLVIDVVGYFK